MKSKKNILNNYYLQVLLIVFLLLFSNNCSKSFVAENIKRGVDYNYTTGLPELRFEVSEHIEENELTKLKITGNVVQSSLIFTKIGNEVKARADVKIDIENHTTNETKSIRFPLTVTREPTDNIYDEKIHIFEREIETSPGNYTVTLSLMDVSSQKTIVRIVEAYLPNPKSEIASITNINLLAKENKKATPYLLVTTYDVSLTSDSVKFSFQVTNNKPADPITIQSRLIKFKSDTMHAEQMSFNNHSASGIAYKGIDYRDYEIIQSSQRTLNQAGNVVIEFVHINLERGNYRFEVAENLSSPGTLYKARDFGIKSPNYPVLRTARELAEPLIYLMDEKSHKQLLSIKIEDSLKSAVDRFWLKHLPNPALAKSVHSLYYQRVEEANKLFSNFKEGWKTDTGKIYILFGPPLDEYKRLKELRWSYNFNPTDPEYTYYFKLTKTKTSFFPFENFLLQRSNIYFTIEYQQRQLWLSGGILHENH